MILTRIGIWLISFVIAIIILRKFITKNETVLTKAEANGLVILAIMIATGLAIL